MYHAFQIRIDIQYWARNVDDTNFISIHSVMVRLGSKFFLQNYNWWGHKIKFDTSQTDCVWHDNDHTIQNLIYPWFAKNDWISRCIYYNFLTWHLQWRTTPFDLHLAALYLIFSQLENSNIVNFKEKLACFV